MFSGKSGEAAERGIYLMLLLSFSAFYLFFLYVGECCLLLYKVFYLSYSEGNFWLDLILLFVCLILDGARITIGFIGLREPMFLKMPLLLAPPIALGYLYLMLWQAYVYTVEWVLCAVAFIGLGAQSYLSFRM